MEEVIAAKPTAGAGESTFAAGESTPADDFASDPAVVDLDAPMGAATS